MKKKKLINIWCSKKNQKIKIITLKFFVLYLEKNKKLCKIIGTKKNLKLHSNLMKGV